MTYKITAAICTYNRYPYLEKAIASLANQNFDPDTYEILVVDNTNDETITGNFWDRLTRPKQLRVLYSHPPGLSRARNLVVREASAPYVCFLDDDAIASPDWLKTLFDFFEAEQGAGVVGGPVHPIWPTYEPDWLPPETKGALTILDLGADTRILEPHEYVCGANIAFRIAALNPADSFDERVGRIGSVSLLSNEEIIVQKQLEAAGWTRGYCAHASVRHHVDENRLSRSWFRSRMAWQAVSEVLSHDEHPYAYGWALNSLLSAAKSLGGAELLQQVFEDANGAALDEQLSLIRHLVGILLFSNQLPAENRETFAGSLNQLAVQEDKTRKQADDKTYRRRPDILSLPALPHIFTEFRESHPYMYDAYALSGKTSYIPFEEKAWQRPVYKSLRTLSDSLHAGHKTLTFLTLDPFLQPWQIEGFFSFVTQQTVAVCGFQHRMPTHTGPRFDHLTRKTLLRLEKVFVYSHDLKDSLEDKYDIPNIVYIPAHSITYAYNRTVFTRDRLNIPDDHSVFSMMGEMRTGKGVELLLEAIPLITRDCQKRMTFIFAGKGVVVSKQEIEDALSDTACNALIFVGDTKTNNFRYLNSKFYGDLINITDLGLLLYQHDQRYCKSGLINQYTGARKTIVATRNSFVGDEVVAHDLGYVLETETPQALAKLLERCADERKSFHQSDKYQEIHRQSTPAYVAKALIDELDTL
ncbi:glycosyltransferase [Eilatimonas milleporae]|uniref:GT2 family glycosyltransferase n=1 Tax=Eilatimonas milleporae TaxID=911205 RepID=A0A3M0C7B8_9PROT|nr:glycosyltransferase [Eilatimonas milleporae]RMB04765.1 GT2 family glycosyltransferase [Eilatimonas milleporae]